MYYRIVAAVLVLVMVAPYHLWTLSVAAFIAAALTTTVTTHFKGLESRGSCRRATMVETVGQEAL